MGTLDAWVGRAKFAAGMSSSAQVSSAQAIENTLLKDVVDQDGKPVTANRWFANAPQDALDKLLPDVNLQAKIGILSKWAHDDPAVMEYIKEHGKPGLPALLRAVYDYLSQFVTVESVKIEKPATQKRVINL